MQFIKNEPHLHKQEITPNRASAPRHFDLVELVGAGIFNIGGTIEQHQQALQWQAADNNKNEGLVTNIRKCSYAETFLVIVPVPGLVLIFIRRLRRRGSPLATWPSLIFCCNYVIKLRRFGQHNLHLGLLTSSEATHTEIRAVSTVFQSYLLKRKESAVRYWQQSLIWEFHQSKSMERRLWRFYLDAFASHPTTKPRDLCRTKLRDWISLVLGCTSNRRSKPPRMCSVSFQQPGSGSSRSLQLLPWAQLLSPKQKAEPPRVLEEISANTKDMTMIQALK